MPAPTDFLYNNARHLFATKQLNWPTEAVNAMLVNAFYVPTLNDLYVSAIPDSAIVSRDIALTSLGEVNGICSGTVPEWQSLETQYPVVAIILYVKTSSDSTSALVYYSSGGSGFPFAGQGFNYSVSYDQSQGGWFQV